MDIIRRTSPQELQLDDEVSWVSSKSADEDFFEDGLSLDLEGSTQLSRGILVYFEVRAVLQPLQAAVPQGPTKVSRSFTSKSMGGASAPPAASG